MVSTRTDEKVDIMIMMPTFLLYRGRSGLASAPDRGERRWLGAVGARFLIFWVPGCGSYRFGVVIVTNWGFQG
jgi:hypothetical protein